MSKHLIQATFDKVGVHILDGKTENFYHLLTGDGVTVESRTGARSTPCERGVGVEQLKIGIVFY